MPPAVNKRLLVPGIWADLCVVVRAYRGCYRHGGEVVEDTTVDLKGEGCMGYIEEDLNENEE